MSFSLDDYNTVPERLREFFDKYPEGVLQQVKYELMQVPMYERDEETKEVRQIGVKTFLAFTGAAYRHAEDPLPGHGSAWEAVPGTTQFTRNSEMQNAETSAWGRAILAVGAADTKKGIASREEVESRRTEW